MQNNRKGKAHGYWLEYRRVDLHPHGLDDNYCGYHILRLQNIIQAEIISDSD